MSDPEDKYKEYKVVSENFDFNYDDEKSVYVTNDTAANVSHINQKTSSKSLNNISFDVVLSPSQGLDKYAYVLFPDLEFTLDQAHTALDTPAAWLAFFENFNTLALRPYSLLNCITSSVQVQMNNRVVNEFSHLQELIPMLHKITDTQEQMPWLINSAGDLYQEYSDYNNLDGNAIKPKIGTRNTTCFLPIVGDVDSPFPIGTQYTALNNRRLVVSMSSKPAVANKHVFVLRDLVMPLPLSIFTSNTKNSGVIYGLEKLRVSFNIDTNNIGNMFSCLPPSIGPGLANYITNNLTVNTDSNPELHLKVYIPPKAISDKLIDPIHPQYVKDWTLPVMNTALLGREEVLNLPCNVYNAANGVITPGTSASLNFHNVTESHVPEYLYLMITKTKQHDTNKRISIPDVGCRVDKLAININGVESFIETSALEIANINSRNGLNISPTHQLYTHGNSYIVINMARDVGLPGGVLVNQQTPLTIRLSATLQNLRIGAVATTDVFSARLFSSSTDLLAYSKGQFLVKKFMDRLSPLDYEVLKLHTEQFYVGRQDNVVGAGMHGGFLGSLFKKVFPIIKRVGWKGLKSAYDGVKKGIQDEIRGAPKGSGGRPGNVSGGLAVQGRQWL